MALQACPECGRQISSLAANCPHCGAPMPGSPGKSPAPAAPQGSERTLYQDADILVTTHRIAVGSKVYLMHGITSVTIVPVTVNRGNIRLGCGLVLLLLSGAFFVTSLSGRGDPEAGAIAAVLGVGLLLSGAWARIKPDRGPKACIEVRTSGGERETVYWSSDEALVRAIVAKINEGMAARPA